jgi:hypothetical protein
VKIQLVVIFLEVVDLEKVFDFACLFPYVLG